MNALNILYKKDVQILVKTSEAGFLAPTIKLFSGYARVTHKLWKMGFLIKVREQLW